MSNHNKIRPVNKNNLNGQYKILFSTPQTPNSNIPKEFRGLQIFPNKLKAEEALRNRKKLTKILEEKSSEKIFHCYETSEIDVFLEDAAASTSTNASNNKYYFVNKMVLPVGVSLVLDDNVNFSSRLFNLRITTVGTSPLVSVIIK